MRIILKIVSFWPFARCFLSSHLCFPVKDNNIKWRISDFILPKAYMLHSIRYNVMLQDTANWKYIVLYIVYFSWYWSSLILPWWPIKISVLLWCIICRIIHLPSWSLQQCSRVKSTAAVFIGQDDTWLILSSQKHDFVSKTMCMNHLAWINAWEYELKYI